jgi:hypothetical protein
MPPDKLPDHLLEQLSREGECAKLRATTAAQRKEIARLHELNRMLITTLSGAIEGLKPDELRAALTDRVVGLSNQAVYNTANMKWLHAWCQKLEQKLKNLQKLQPSSKPHCL